MTRSPPPTSSLYRWQSEVALLLDSCDTPCIVLLQGGRGKSHLRLARSEVRGEAWLEEEQLGGGLGLTALQCVVERLGGRIVVNLLPGSELSPAEDDEEPTLEVDGVRAWIL